MPFIQRDDAKIYYETFGEGFPVLAFAPGYLRSEMAFWKHSPSDPSRKAPWPNVPVALVPPFRVIAMDQRYAGKSEAAITADVGWQTYAGDHLAILDALEIDRCHLIGVCIGTAFALTLAERAPERIASAVLMNPVGRTEANRVGTMAEFARWADAYRATHPEADPDALAAWDATCSTAISPSPQPAKRPRACKPLCSFSPEPTRKTARTPPRSATNSSSCYREPNSSPPGAPIRIKPQP